jgi:hypothetical protein
MDWGTIISLLNDKIEQLDHSVVIDYENCKINVRSNMEDQISKIKEVLGLLCSNEFTCRKDICSLYSFADQEIWRGLSCIAEGCDKGEEVFLHETSKYYKFEFLDAALLVEYDRRSFIVCLYRNKNYFFIRELGRDFGEKDTVRLLRHILQNSAIGAGGITLHASAVKINNSGLCIIGPSGSGKTTILLNSLKNPNAQIISNDKVILFNIDSEFYISGTSYSANIIPGTLNGFPDFKRFIIERYAKHTAVMDFIASNFENSPVTKAKIALPLLEVAYGMNVGLVKTWKLSLLLFPDFNANYPDNQCRIASEEEILIRLNSEVLPPAIFYYDHWTGLGKISREEYRERVDKMISGLLKSKIRGIFVKGNRFMYNFNQWEQILHFL